jgi:hypothetical protein
VIGETKTPEMRQDASASTLTLLFREFDFMGASLCATGRMRFPGREL